MVTDLCRFEGSMAYSTPCYSQIISEMLTEIHTMEKFAFSILTTNNLILCYLRLFWKGELQPYYGRNAVNTRQTQTNREYYVRVFRYLVYQARSKNSVGMARLAKPVRRVSNLKLKDTCFSTHYALLADLMAKRQ